MTLDETQAAEIRERFDVNARRVDSFVEHYRVLKAGQSARGRAAVEASDILRAATVFLHATVEDLLRSLLEWRLPKGRADHLDGIPFPNPAKRKRSDSIRLKELAGYRGRTVDEVIAQSISLHLDRRSFNNLGEIRKALNGIGLPDNDVKAILAKQGCHANIAALMARRHLIVHRFDRNEESGQGHHAARSISAKLVEDWRRAAGVLASGVLSAIEGEC